MSNMTETEIVAAALAIYQTKGNLILKERTVIGDRVYDPAVYTLTHVGSPKHG